MEDKKWKAVRISSLNECISRVDDTLHDLPHDVSTTEKTGQMASCTTGYSENKLPNACGGKSNSDSNDMSDEDETRIKEIGDYLQKKALTNCRINLLERMKPAGILDIFKTEAIYGQMTTIQVRNIEEMRNTTDKNREIVKAIESRPPKYIVFKTALVKTGQAQLKEMLEGEELSEHMKLQERHECLCEDARACPVLQDLVCPISSIEVDEKFAADSVTAGETKEKEEGTQVRYVTNVIHGQNVQIGDNNLMVDKTRKSIYADTERDSQRRETTDGAKSTDLPEEGKSPSAESQQEGIVEHERENKSCAKTSTIVDTNKDEDQDRHSVPDSQDICTKRKSTEGQAQDVSCTPTSDHTTTLDHQQTEWPTLSYANVARKKRNSGPEQPTSVQNLPLASGINISHNFYSTNTQIGDNNAIVTSMSEDHNPTPEKDAEDNSNPIERIGTKLKSYAHITKSPNELKADNLNIHYNFNVNQAVIQQPHTDNRQEEVTTFLQKTRYFDDGHYILVIGSVKPVKNLSILGLVPWTAVLDYDPESRLNGLFSYVAGTIEKKRSLHIKTWQDKCSFNDQSTCWIFMKGSTDRPESVLEKDFKDWKDKINKDPSSLIGQLRTFKQGHTEYTIVVVWHEDKEIVRHFKFTMLQLEHCLSPSFLLVNDGYDKSTFPDFDHFNEIQTVDLTIQGICQAVQRKFKHDDNDEFLSYKLPTSDKTNEPDIDETYALYLNEELEVLYLDNQTGINYDLKELQEEEENFFRGGTLPWAWWYNVGGGHADAERDIKDDIVKFIKEEHIEMCKSGCVTLYHAPGSGGTTLAQRILWDFRKEIPCVEVQHRSGQSLDGLAEKIQFLSEKTHLPILLLIDGEEEQKVEHIQRILHCCVIVLYVKRCHEKPKLKFAEFWLKPFVTKREGKSIGMKYLDQCSRLNKTSKQQKAVRDLIDGIAQDSEHTIFEFGLAVHSYEYKGIYSYVKGFLRLDETTEQKLMKWQTALVMLSLAYYYGHTSVPCQFLSTLIHPQKNTKVLRFEEFPTEMKELVVRDPHERRGNCVRISHYYVAKEILDQVLLWRQGTVLKREASPLISIQAKKALSPFVIDFIEIAGEVYTNTASDTVLKILIQTIISRDNTAVGENEVQAPRSRKPRLAPIIEDVSTRPPYTERINVVEKLTKSFPREPQFHAHLGRVYTICRPEMEDKAEQCFKAALDICETETKGIAEDDIPQNMKLTLMHVYHMYGNMFSTRVSKYTGRNISDKPRIPTTESDFEDVSRKLLSNTSRSCKLFTKCRGITPPGCEKSVGYIGEINVRLMFCDYINRHKCKKRSRSIHEFVQEDESDISEFVGDCFVKLDELFIDCFSTIEPEKMDTNVWSCQEWYVTLFNTQHMPGHMMQRNDESLDNSRRKIVILKMKYSDPRTLGVLDLVSSSDDIRVIVEEYEKIFEGFDQGIQSYRITKRDLDIDYREWLFAIRHPKFLKEYDIDLVLTHVEKWFDSIKTQSARFYLFILKSLLGFGNDTTDGNTFLLIEAQALKEELVKYSKYSSVTKPRYPREWLGPSATGIRRLYPGLRFFGQIEGRETPHNGSTTDLKLQVMKGTINPPNDKPAVGYISLDLGLANRVTVQIFYVPAISGMQGVKNGGSRVEFVIGFSVAHGYEAFNVRKLGKAYCLSCGKQNEFRKCDQAVMCTGTGCRYTVTRPATPKKRETFK